MPIDLPGAVLAVGGLGTASSTIVEGLKSFDAILARSGFVFVRNALDHILHGVHADMKECYIPSKKDILDTLYGNWINGKRTGEQISAAKTLIKLCLVPGTAETLARNSGVTPSGLLAIANKYVSGDALTSEERDVIGRFDLILTAKLTSGYQRADQVYRLRMQVFALLVSVILAVLGTYALYGSLNHWLEAVIVGLLAAPLAPVAKDLSSGLAAAMSAIKLTRSL